MKAIVLSVVVLTCALLAGCGPASTPAATKPAAADSPSPASSPSPSATAAPAAPDTAAAAKAAAVTYFGLYGAGQYNAVYPMIAPAARSKIRESVWIGLHDKCRSSATANLSYKVSHPILAGTTAVVSVGFAGAASALGSEQITFTYVGGQWYYEPSDLGVYRHHDLAEAVAAAKAADVC